MCMCLKIPKSKGRQTQAGVSAPDPAIVDTIGLDSLATPEGPSITTAVIAPAAPTPAPVTNAMTLASPSTPISRATTPNSPSVPIPPLLAGTATPSSSSAPGITNSPPPILGSSSSSVTASASLWKQALNKVGDKVLVDIGCDKSHVTGHATGISLVENIIREINQRKNECDEKRWFYINERGEKVFYVEVLLGRVNRYVLVGDIAIQHHPDIVALAWAGFRVLLQVGTSYTENMRVVSESLSYIVHTLCCCDIYEKLYCDRKFGITEALNISIVNQYVSILEYLNYARKYIKENTSVRILKSFFSELGQLLDAIRANEKEVERDAGIAEKEASAVKNFDQEKKAQELKGLLVKIQEPVEKIESAVERIYAMVQGERRIKVLEWLSDVKFGSHHLFSSVQRQRDTGIWLLENEKFSEWRSSMSSSIFWLRGDAGSGKTILASFIIDEFQDQAKCNEHVLAYFYCDYKQAERRDPASILRTLVKQFCLKDPGNPGLLPELVLSTYQKREQNGHSSGPLSLEESKDLIIKLSEKYLQTTIIIDALDECDRNTRRGLFSALYNIVSSTRQVKIFLTSRFDSDIVEIFATFPSHYINARDNSRDINMYINAEVERRCDPRKRSGAEKLLLNGVVDPALKNKIILTLQNKANGMFMWAHFQILNLCEQHTPGGISKALNELPKDLEATYYQILERVDSQNSSSKRMAKIVLGWLLYAQEPCSTASVIQALAVNPGKNTLDEDGLYWKPQTILSICQNLVVHDEKLQNFRFAHFSVQEFLLRHPEFQEEKGHIYMAEVCITALTYLDRGVIPNLIDYATYNWGTHAFFSGSGTSTLQKICQAFLRPSSAYIMWHSRVIRQDRTLQSRNSGIISPLWVACYYQLYDTVKFLLENCENLNDDNYDGKTQLFWAAEKGYEKLVQLLLAKDGVDVNSTDIYSQTPLSEASANGHEGVVQLLLAKDGVDVNSNSIYSQTPLSQASANGHEGVVQLLLAKDGVDVNSKDAYNKTPLSQASVNGHEKVVLLLLTKDGVDVNSKDSYKRTPLSWAAKNGHEKVVQLLLAKDGVDVNSKDSLERTPLFWAANNVHEKVVQLLLAKDGVDANSKDSLKRTPLFWAARNGHEKVVQLLLTKDGVDVNSNGHTRGLVVPTHSSNKSSHSTCD